MTDQRDITAQLASDGRTTNIKVGIDLTPAVLKLMDQVRPDIQAQTLRKIVEIVEAQVAAGQAQSAEDVLKVLRAAVDFFQRQADEARAGQS